MLFGFVLRCGVLVFQFWPDLPSSVCIYFEDFLNHEFNCFPLLTVLIPQTDGQNIIRI